MPSLHKFTDNFDIVEGLAAASRTTTGGEGGGAVYGTASIKVYERVGELLAVVTAGTVATSLDGRWQESDDESTWTDITGAAMTQLTAAGSAKVPLKVRQTTKPYVRFVLEHGGTCVDAVVIMSEKNKIP